MKKYLLLFSFLVIKQMIMGQDYLNLINNRLTEIALVTPGLNDTVNFSVTGVSLQEFLRGLAETSELNISVNPNLKIQVYNNFTNEKVSNIILFLCKEYQLDIHFVGSIMSFDRYVAKALVVPLKEKIVNVFYNKEKDELSLDLLQDTISIVVKKITQISGKNIILSPQISQQKIVNGFIKSVSFENAIDKFAFTNGLLLRKTKGDFYILDPLPKENLSTSSRRNRNNSINQNTLFELSEEVQLSIKDSIGDVFVTLSVNEVEIQEILNAVSNKARKSYYLSSAPSGKATIQIKNLAYDDFLTLLLEGTQHTFRKDHDVYLIGERIKEGFRDTKVVTLQYRSLNEVSQIIPSEMRKGVEINEFPDLNSFILSGSSPQIREIEKFIKAIDKTVPMITIEVIMVEVRRGKTLKTGIHMGVGDSTQSGGTLLPGIDFTLSTNSINGILDKIPINLGKVNPNFYTRLTALDQQENINVRSMPKLATLNGHEANLSIGQTRYYSVEQQNFIGSLNPNLSVTRTWQSVQADLSISINPVVSGDNQVTLDISVEVSDFLGEPQNNAPPNSTTSQFNSLIRVGNEEMILLGGIERIEKSESGEGVPFLSRIPIIKWFFSKRSKSKKKSIFIVFIKPTVVY